MQHLCLLHLLLTTFVFKVWPAHCKCVSNLWLSLQRNSRLPWFYETLIESLVYFITYLSRIILLHLVFVTPWFRFFGLRTVSRLAQAVDDYVQQTSITIWLQLDGWNEQEQLESKEKQIKSNCLNSKHFKMHASPWVKVFALCPTLGVQSYWCFLFCYHLLDHLLLFVTSSAFCIHLIANWLSKERQVVTNRVMIRLEDELNKSI